MSATVEFDAVDGGSVSERNCSHSEPDDDVRRYDVRQRMSREEKRAEFEELVRSGQVRVRTVSSPEEALKYGVDLEQLRLRREQAEKVAAEPRQRTAPLPRAKAAPPDPALVAKMRAARVAEGAAMPRAVTRRRRREIEQPLDLLMLEAFNTIVATEIAQVVELDEAVVRNRLRRARGTR